MRTGAVVSGEPLAQMLTQHRDSLLAYILALVHDWCAAEEVLQEASLVMLRKQREGIAVRDFGPWSREIARRTTLNYWKKSCRARLVLSAEAIDAVDRAFEHQEHSGEIDEEALMQRLRTCLKRLPEHLLRIIELRYRRNLSLQQIGRELERTSGAVQVALSRIRARLLDCTRQCADGREAGVA